MNEDQIAYWNGAGGARWTTQQTALDHSLAEFGRAALDIAAVRAGERVLDVGCGCGVTSLALADHVGPKGSVVGVDVSAPMLARAAERGAGVSQLRFLRADAAATAFAPDHDLVFSRFGVMFFDDPKAAFANLRAALAPGGRMAFVCWRSFDDNPWAKVPMDAVSGVVPLPDPPPWKSDGPGPFSFGERDRLSRLLSDAGFSSVSIERFEARVSPPVSDLEGAVDFMIHAGPASRLLGSASPDVVARAREALARVLAVEGFALLGSTWLVTAH